MLLDLSLLITSARLFSRILMPPLWCRTQCCCSQMGLQDAVKGPQSHTASHYGPGVQLPSVQPPDPEIRLSSCPQMKLITGDRKQRGSHIFNALPNEQAKLILLIGVGTANLLSAERHPHSTALFLPEETGPISVLVCLH